MTGLIFIFLLLGKKVKKLIEILGMTLYRDTLILGNRLVETVRDSFMLMLLPLYGKNQKHWSAAGAV